MALIDAYRDQMPVSDDVSDREILQILVDSKEREIARRMVIDKNSVSYAEARFNAGILDRIIGETKAELLAFVTELLDSIVSGKPSAKLEGVSESFLEEYDIVREVGTEFRLRLVLAMLIDEDPEDPDDDEVVVPVDFSGGNTVVERQYPEWRAAA